MAGIADFIRLAVDGGGKRVMNLLHLDFYSAGVPGYQQLTGIADPTDPTIVGAVATGRPGAAVPGIVTREARDNFDSGIIALVTGFTEVTAALTEVKGLYIANVTGVVQLVNITNHAGDYYRKNYQLQAGQSETIPMHGCPMLGIQASTPNPNTVNFQAWGRQ